MLACTRKDIFPRPRFQFHPAAAGAVLLKDQRQNGGMRELQSAENRV